MTIIHFVRHGEVYNPGHILYGRLPGFRLSEAGQAQAAAAGAYLAGRPLVAVISSPLLRARQTAAHIARPHNLPVEESALLNEVDTPHMGRPIAELEAEEWKIYTNLPPGWETPQQVVERAVQQIAILRERFPEGEVAVVSHGDVVLATRFWVEGIPFCDDTKNRVRLYPATASITTLTFNGSSTAPLMTYHRPY